MSMPMGYTKLDPSVVTNLKNCLWGNSELKQDVFSRWCQGFIFSETSPSALVQFEGGPCAVLVPVQAFLVKAALFQSEHSDVGKLFDIAAERARDLLLEALSDILTQMTNTEEFVIVGYHQVTPDEVVSPSSDPHTSGETISHDETLTASNLDFNLNVDSFHSSLTFCKCSSSSDLKDTLKASISTLQSRYGVMLYIYSILLTKGIDEIKNEVEDPSEPLIDSTFGHGSQSLINLLLTSKAISNVWDNDKEIDGLKLRGIQKQSEIGFLTLLEQLRYCEVGWYFKNPKNPIWVLGSETHLSLLFSPTVSLVVRETPEMNANLVFTRFDPEGNGFVATSLLGDLLAALDLVSEKEYVDIMIAKLDAEGFGIVTQSSFMEEFFPERSSEQPSQFSLYHYNGLVQSSTDGKHFVECKATMADEIDTQFITDTSPIKLCLQTKWPSIDLEWKCTSPPSLN